MIEHSEPEEDAPLALQETYKRESYNRVQRILQSKTEASLQDLS